MPIALTRSETNSAAQSVAEMAQSDESTAPAFGW